MCVCACVRACMRACVRVYEREIVSEWVCERFLRVRVCECVSAYVRMRAYDMCMN